MTPAVVTPAYLDEVARTYYLNTEAITDLGPDELQQERSAALIADLVADRPRVLELGVGIGRTIEELRARGLDHDIVEGSPLLAREARGRWPGIRVHEALFEEFVPAEPYDAVLALHVLEHVDDPVATLRACARWLKPGGRVVCAVPNAESLHRRLAVHMGIQPELDALSPRDVLLGHQRVYTLDELAADCTAAGFDVAVRTGWFVKTLTNGQMAGFPRDLLDALFDVSSDLDPRLLANVAIAADLRPPGKG